MILRIALLAMFLLSCPLGLRSACAEDDPREVRLQVHHVADLVAAHADLVWVARRLVPGASVEIAGPRLFVAGTLAERRAVARLLEALRRAAPESPERPVESALATARLTLALGHARTLEARLVGLERAVGAVDRQGARRRLEGVRQALVPLRELDDLVVSDDAREAVALLEHALRLALERAQVTRLRLDFVGRDVTSLIQETESLLDIVAQCGRDGAHGPPRGIPALPWPLDKPVDPMEVLRADLLSAMAFLRVAREESVGSLADAMRRRATAILARARTEIFPVLAREPQHAPPFAPPRAWEDDAHLTRIGEIVGALETEIRQMEEALRELLPDGNAEPDADAEPGR